MSKAFVRESDEEEDRPKNRMRLQSVQKLHEHIEVLDSRYSGSDGDQQD